MSVLTLIAPMPNAISLSLQGGTAWMNLAIEMLKNKQNLFWV